MSFEIIDIAKEAAGRLWLHISHGAYHMRPHTHAELEWNLVLQGNARYIMNGRTYELAARSLVWLFPQQDHMLAHNSPDFRMWVLVIRPDTIAAHAHTGNFRTLREKNPAGVFCRRLAREAATHLTKRFEEVEQLRDTPDVFNAGLVYALLESWQAFQHASAETRSEEVHPSVEKAAHLLKSTPAVSIDDLANDVHLSRSQLSRLFARQIGQPLVQYRNRCRLERFLQIYGTGERTTMLHAALDAGFGSYPQFHRVFHALMGMPPAHYRAQQKTR